MNHVTHRALLLALVCLAPIVSCGSGDGDGNEALSRPAGVDVNEVQEEERTFVDTSRLTRANGSAPASEERILLTRVWYAPTALATPACHGERCALVVLAHGFGGRTSRFDAMARSLASTGYVVAAPAFPLTNEDTPGGHVTGLNDVLQQPADVSVVIDGLLAAAADRKDPLFGRIDDERIGALGHSLGGTTVLAATHAGCCIDQRIDAAVLVAPVGLLISGLFRVPIEPSGPPLLVINGSDDPLVLPAASRELAHSLTPPWYYLEIHDVGHVFLIENIGNPQPPLYVTARAAHAFFDEYLGGTLGTTAATLEDLAAEGEHAEFSEP